MSDSYGGSPLQPNTSPTFPDVVTRVCPKCSVQSQTDGAFCPHCGAPYSRARGRRPSKWLVVSIVGVLVLGCLVIGLLVKHSTDQAHARKAVAAKSRASVSASKARAAESRSAASVSAAAASRSRVTEERALERSVRNEMVKEMEHSITKDARKDVADGILDGPILSTDCSPTNGGSMDDLSARTTAFSCLAVTSKDASSGTEQGYRFSALMNWTAGSYSWHLGD